MKKQLLMLLTISIFALKLSAQQKVKDGTITGGNLPNKDALLELESNNKGLLHVRVALIETTNPSPLTAHVAGMMVYNTAISKDVVPGIYYNDGTKWVKNSKGDTGATGPQGPIGLTGATGPQGVPGVKGNTGDTGPQGPIGVTGATGPQGIPGVKGDTGAQGPIGLTGATGPQGIPGVKGDTGAQGPIGLTGATGPQGAPGINGTNGVDGVKGDKGDTGAQGPIGLTGATGPQGTPGINGTNGVDGAKGDKGDTGAQGPIGLTGATGPQGAPGINGTNGVDGAKGDKGDTGAQGPIGLTGATGPQGAPGINGTNGVDGAQGPIGLTGATGPQGTPGINGTNGVDGAQGPQGIQGPKGDPGANGQGGVSQAGTGINITGTGTTADPYIINNTIVDKDNQTITDFSLDNTTKILTLTLERGNTKTVDLTALTNSTADNGLTKTGVNTQLGGTLIKPTTIETDVTNTLALTGLQTGAATDNIVVAGAGGVLKTIPASTLSTEPWNVQETSNKAVVNTENIYQNGKVSIGSTNATPTTTKQLEVVGDFKTETAVGGRAVGLETNFQGSGVSILYNADNLTAPTDMAMIQVHSNSLHQIAQSPTNLGAVQIAPGTVEYRTGNWGLTNGVSLHHMDKDQTFLMNEAGTPNVDRAQLTLSRASGINFSFNNNAGVATGNYTFPRVNGTAGQALVAGGITGGQLEWKNVNDLVTSSEPLQIQGTTTKATLNDDNVYQKGNLAVGDFTGTTSTKNFEVKGDVKMVTKTQDANGMYHSIETNIDGATNIALVDDLANPQKYNVLSLSKSTTQSFLMDNAAASRYILNHATADGQLSQVFSVNNGTGQNLQLSNLILTAPGANGNIGAALGTSDYPNDFNGAISTSSATGTQLVSNYLTNTKGNGLNVDREKGVGINSFLTPTSNGYLANYYFPKNNGAPGQVLVTDGTVPTMTNFAQLSWADASTLTAMPKFFYAPTVVLPAGSVGVSTNAADDIYYDAGTEIYTVKLYSIYQRQFGMVGDVAGTSRTAIKSASATTLPLFPVTGLEYFVTYFDNTVFDPASITLDDNGVMTYKVLPTATVTAKTYMNIAFKVK
ncbi:hypothetical protein [Pedobacter punctiformis]|uniref:Collagen triple helix repeat-containing protein n=1 Tax=Pedobacter punctiformis TaxID=3004097 RepID=A0ABT4LD92_9SPHI|nr:hypothetical protein [Pedobacter sp. HCMS5-2]MCZ4245133.1 hypothetical protein [Pedobacter sp. HCMS5-2]